MAHLKAIYFILLRLIEFGRADLNFGNLNFETNFGSDQSFDPNYNSNIDFNSTNFHAQPVQNSYTSSSSDPNLHSIHKLPITSEDTKNNSSEVPSSSDQHTNCTINQCLNGFCILNRTSTLGYDCFCKDGYTGYHCQVKYRCRPNYCKNGATCVEENGELMCFCKNGYKGKYCEELIDNCSSSPCSNGSRCRNFENGYECICTDGFSGKNCEQDIDVCTVDKCRNNGTCLEGLGNDYRCECEIGFEGADCEIAVNKCEPNPCKNRGQCVSIKPGDYKCNCECEYTGRNCENKVQFCKENDLCLNQGVCLIVEDYVAFNSTLVKFEKNVCYCKPSSYGDRCEFHYSKCLHLNTICENNGTCVDGIESNEPFKCVCGDNFKGKYCEIDCKRTGDCASDHQVELTPSISLGTKHDQPSTSTDVTPPIPEISTTYLTNSLSDEFLTPTFISITHTPSDIKPTDPLSFPSTPYFNVTEQKKDRRPNADDPLDQNQNSNLPFIPFDKNQDPNKQNTSSDRRTDISLKTKGIFSSKFNGLNVNSSFLQFERDRHEFATSFMVHFDFNTQTPDGILFHAEAELDPIVFAIVYLEQGLLKLSFSCNQQNTLYLISDKHHQLNNNQMNHVQMRFKLDLRRGVCESQIQLNNSLSINKNQTSSVKSNSRMCFKQFNFGNKQGNNLYLPAIPPFRGCLTNIHINNNLKLVKDASRAEYLEECDLERICDLSPCGRHGDCPSGQFATMNSPDNFTNRMKRKIHASLPFQTDHSENQNGLNSNNFRNLDDRSKKDDSRNNQFIYAPSSETNRTSDDWKCTCHRGYLGKFCELATCDPNPCSNETVCVLVSNSELRCLCAEHKFGAYCDLDFSQHSPRFDRQSYLAFPVEHRNGFIEIMFNFTTLALEQNNALLLYMGQVEHPAKMNRMDYFRLTIDKMILNFKISLAHGTKEIYAKLSDHQNFHQIRLGHSRRLFWLSVDNQQKVEDQLSTISNSLVVEDKLWIGGHPFVSKIERLSDVDFFEGCIFNVSIRTNHQNPTFTLMNKIIANYNVGQCEENECK